MIGAALGCTVGTLVEAVDTAVGGAAGTCTVVMCAVIREWWL